MAGIYQGGAPCVDRHQKPAVMGAVRFPLIAFLFFVAPPAYADFSGRVVDVSDGDKIMVPPNDKAEKIRLVGERLGERWRGGFALPHVAVAVFQVL
jgi:hypothetical protein